jgi:hypothetical protein
VQVCLLASAADADSAAEVQHALKGFGMDIGRADADRILALLSPAALADPAWRARYEHLAARPAARFIPVSFGEIKPSEVPSALRGLNWIPWPARTAFPAAQAVQAIGGDPALYTQSRALRGEADAWDESGRPEELLIADPRRAKAAEEFLERSRADTWASPSARLREFVEASLALRKRNRRKRRNRWLRRAFALAVVGVVAYIVISDLRLTAKTSRLTAAVDITLNPDFPSRTAELAGATLIQGYDAAKPTARIAMLEVLPRPWGEGMLGLNHDGGLLDGVTVPRRNTLWTVEGGGSVVRWNRETGVTVERRKLAPGRLEAIDADADGRTLVAGGLESVWIISTTPWQSRRVEVGSAVDGVALDYARRAVVTHTAAGLAVVSTHTHSVVRRIAHSNDVLDMRRVASGRVFALLRRGRELALVDAVTGAVRSRRAIRGWQFETGAVGPDGRSAVISGPDRQLHYAPRNLRFEPTGLPTTELTDVVALLPRRRVAYGNPEFGVRVAEIDSGLFLGQICTDVLTVEVFRTLPAEPSVLCGNGYTMSIWNPDELGPTPAPPKSVPLHRSKVDRQPPYRLEATAQGRITLLLEQNGKLHRIDELVPKERWTTAAMWEGHSLHVAVGGATGHVEAFDIAGGGDFKRVLDWRAPDATAVTALGWEPRGDAPLRVKTASGRWWRVPSCILCSRDGRLVDLARKRLHMCEVPEAQEALTDRAKQLLELRICPKSVRPVPG